MKHRPNPIDYLDIERVVLAMCLRKPLLLSSLEDGLFEEPGHLAVFHAMRRLRTAGLPLSLHEVRNEAAHAAQYVPEPWFTVANADFYLACLERRRTLKVQRALLVDAVHALDEGVDPGVFLAGLPLSVPEQSAFKVWDSSPASESQSFWLPD